MIISASDKLIHTIEVRFFDLDANNHVNNSVYFTYMEEARTKLLMKPYLQLKEKGIQFVVVEATCKYKKPIKLNDEVKIEMTLQPTRRVSFEVLYTFINPEGEIYAEGKTVMACFNEKTQRPVAIPTDLTEQVKGR